MSTPGNGGPPQTPAGQQTTQPQLNVLGQYI
jgi:hypothetical protein